MSLGQGYPQTFLAKEVIPAVSHKHTLPHTGMRTDFLFKKKSSHSGNETLLQFCRWPQQGSILLSRKGIEESIVE